MSAKNDLNPWRLVGDDVRSAHLAVSIATEVADETEIRNIDYLHALTRQGDDFIFFTQGLGLALFVFFCFFELTAQVALTIAVHHGFVFIDAELLGDRFLIDLIVGAQGEIDHALGNDRKGQ